jgi:WD40 repeat protein
MAGRPRRAARIAASGSGTSTPGEPSPGGETFLTGSGDQTARFWRAHALEPLGEPLRHRGQVWSVAFAPDGRTAATGASDGAVRFWDAADRRPTAVPLANRWPVRSVAFAGDGQTLLAGSWLDSSRLWDVATGKPLEPPRLHSENLLAAAFDPAGTRVWAVTEDGLLMSDAVSRVDTGDIAALLLWIRLATCMELGTDGGVSILEPDRWLELRRTSGFRP